MNKKFILYISIAIILISVGSSYAYYALTVVGTGTSIMFKNKELFIEYEQGSSLVVEEEDLVAPWSITKNFTVTNASEITFSYNILVKDLINNMVSNTLSYTLTETNNAFSTTSILFPVQSTASDYVMAYNVSIPAGATQAYSLVLTYPNSLTVNQSNDTSFSGTLDISYPYNITVNLTNGLLSNNTTTITSKADSITNFNLTANSGYKTESPIINCTSGSGIMSSSSTSSGGTGIFALSNVNEDTTCNITLNSAN